MAILNAFDASTTESNIKRLENLNKDTQPKWGTMNAGQMLAHLNVAYKIEDGTINPKPNFLMKFILKTFIKGIVVSDKPFKKNGKTAPVFEMTTEKNFNTEKELFVNYMKKVQEKGASSFDGRVNPSFGKLTTKEWSNLFQKHIEHHFDQFGL